MGSGDQQHTTCCNCTAGQCLLGVKAKQSIKKLLTRDHHHMSRKSFLRHALNDIVQWHDVNSCSWHLAALCLRCVSALATCMQIQQGSE